jgi:hypothetical protein
MVQSHVKIVPTLFEPLGGRIVDSNQFSATDFMQDLAVRPRTVGGGGWWAGVRWGARAARLTC